MGFSVGIVGLPNVGKSTLFNAIIQQQRAEVSNYPFCTIAPNKALVEIPDSRLALLATKLNLERKIPAVLEIVDIAGLVKGAHRGEGLGNEFLSHIQGVDVILQVVRFFPNPEIAGVVDPESDIELINTELALKDLQILESLEEKLEKQIKAQQKEAIRQKEIILKIKENLEAKEKIWEELLPEEIDFVKSLSLLSIKPTIYVANVSEKQLQDGNWQNLVQNPKDFIPICAKLESEIIELEENEKEEYLKAFGVQTPAIQKIIQKAAQALDLITFYTLKVGEQIQAWTVKKNTKAPQAAGKIHSDFEKNFIAVEVIDFETLLKEGDFKKAKEKGRVKTEGKDYIIRDGDVVYFLHH